MTMSYPGTHRKSHRCVDLRHADVRIVIMYYEAIGILGHTGALDTPEIETRLGHVRRTHLSIDPRRRLWAKNPIDWDRQLELLSPWMALLPSVRGTLSTGPLVGAAMVAMLGGRPNIAQRR
jgi:hypothetical protein